MPADARASRCLGHKARRASSQASRHGDLLCKVVTLLVCIPQHVGAANLLRSRATAGDNDVVDYWLLQRVGFEDEGFAPQPGSPHDKNAHCLTVSDKRDRKNGFALYWHQCEDLSARKVVQNNSAIMNAQSFRFTEDGTVKDRVNDYCLRYLPCKEDDKEMGYMYDVGPCFDTTAVKIGVTKFQANSNTHPRELGYLKQAVGLELCETVKLCGAYQLQNVCPGGGCGGSYQAHPGWTKLASNYVGDAAVFGHSDYHVGGSGISQQAQVLGLDLSGIGPTRDDDGLCGSFAGEALLKTSMYYVLHAENSGRRRRNHA